MIRFSASSQLRISSKKWEAMRKRLSWHQEVQFAKARDSNNFIHNKKTLLCQQQSKTAYSNTQVVPSIRLWQVYRMEPKRQTSKEDKYQELARDIKGLNNRPSKSSQIFQTHRRCEIRITLKWEYLARMPSSKPWLKLLPINNPFKLQFCQILSAKRATETP